MKAACGSGCDARRLSTGRSIRAWRTLSGRQMTRNAGRTRYPIAALRAAWAGAHAGPRGGGGFSAGVFLIGIRRDPSDQRACDAAAPPPEPSASPAICDKAEAVDARKRFESLGLRGRNGGRLWRGVRARRRMRHRRRRIDDWLKSFKQVAINKGVRRPDLKRLPWSETDFRDAHADPHEAGEPGPA